MFAYSPWVLSPHINFNSFALNFLRSDTIIDIGRVLNKYKTLGKIVILTEYNRPNHEGGLFDHLLRSFNNFFKHVRVISPIKCGEGVRKIPKYGRASVCHLKGNKLRKARTMCVCKDTLSAWDLEWFTHKPVMDVNCHSTIFKLGNEVTGEEKSSNMSSANNAHLCLRSPQWTPFIFR